MCARLLLPVTDEELAAFLEISELPEWKPRYNIAPGQDVLVVRRGPSGERRASLLRWGLGERRLINARSETATRRAPFRDSFRSQRCLVPAAGFYEWKKVGRVRQPYVIRPRSGLVALAGLWEPGKSRAGGALDTFTVLTTEANERIAPVHDRMPVILERSQFATWLDPERRQSDLLALMKPYPAERVTFQPVSTRVNRPEFDDPGCLLPPAAFPPSQKSLF